MFKKNIISTLLLSSLFITSNAYTQSDEKTATNDGSQDIKVVLQNNEALNKSDFIINYYKNKGSNGRVSLNKSFTLNEPMEMSELADLNHSYFKNGNRDLTLDELNKSIIENSSDEVKGLRINSVYNEALMIGVQNGLFKVLFNFRKDLDAISDELSQIFNFDELMLANGQVVPPVILELGSGVEKESEILLRKKDAGYEIYKQAKVSLQSPSYYQYLNFEPIKPKEPEDILMPINDIERSLWKKGAQEGWILGLKQGNAIINEGMAALIRDYVGMNRFHMMRDARLISMPALERFEIGTTTNGKSLNIGEITFKVTILPEFNANTQAWKALPQIDDFLFKGDESWK
jgi:defect-in-organelle-trafficking protein DotC